MLDDVLMESSASAVQGTGKSARLVPLEWQCCVTNGWPPLLWGIPLNRVCGAKLVCLLHGTRISFWAAGLQTWLSTDTCKTLIYPLIMLCSSVWFWFSWFSLSHSWTFHGFIFVLFFFFLVSFLFFWIFFLENNDWTVKRALYCLASQPPA